jgi:hypothetical protein
MKKKTWFYEISFPLDQNFLSSSPVRVLAVHSYMTVTSNDRVPVNQDAESSTAVYQWAQDAAKEVPGAFSG